MAAGARADGLEVWMVHPDLGIGGAEMLVVVSGGMGREGRGGEAWLTKRSVFFF